MQTPLMLWDRQVDQVAAAVSVADQAAVVVLARLDKGTPVLMAAVIMLMAGAVALVLLVLQQTAVLGFQVVIADRRCFMQVAVRVMVPEPAEPAAEGEPVLLSALLERLILAAVAAADTAITKVELAVRAL